MAGLSRKHVRDIETHTDAVIQSCKLGLDLLGDKDDSDMGIRLIFIRNRMLVLEDYIEGQAESRT